MASGSVVSNKNKSGGGLITEGDALNNSAKRTYQADVDSWIYITISLRDTDIGNGTVVKVDGEQVFYAGDVWNSRTYCHSFPVRAGQTMTVEIINSPVEVYYRVYKMI